MIRGSWRIWFAPRTNFFMRFAQAFGSYFLIWIFMVESAARSEQRNWGLEIREDAVQIHERRLFDIAFGLYDFFRKCSSPGMSLPLSSFSTCMIVHPPTASRSPPNFGGPSCFSLEPVISWIFRQSVSYVPCSANTYPPAPQAVHPGKVGLAACFPYLGLVPVVRKNIKSAAL